MTRTSSSAWHAFECLQNWKFCSLCEVTIAEHFLEAEHPNPEDVLEIAGRVAQLPPLQQIAAKIADWVVATAREEDRKHPAMFSLLNAVKEDESRNRLRRFMGLPTAQDLLTPED